MPDLWHFPRSADAERIVAMLGVGLVSALSIIEPRRRGKTTFLQDDLLPAARKAGYLPIYLNLATGAPGLETEIAAGIEAALRDRAGLASRLRAMGQARVKKLAGKASLATGELGGEVELESPFGRGDERLAPLFRQLSRSRAPVMFLFDEVHTLADAQHSALAWGLRSLLDSHRDRLKVVATSSSAATYELLVSGEKKAFKSWFTRIAITPLGGEFVAHLAAVVKKHYPEHPITRGHIVAAFEALGQSPKFIRDYLNARILDPRLAHEIALRATAADAAKDSGYEDEFRRLVPLQRATLFALLGERTELFSEAALRSFAAAIEATEVSKSAVQRAAGTLAAKGWIIRQDRGDYRITDSLFEQWLRAQVKTGLLQGPSEGSPNKAGAAKAPGRVATRRANDSGGRVASRRTSRPRR